MQTELVVPFLGAYWLELVMLRRSDVSLKKYQIKHLNGAVMIVDMKILIHRIL